MRPECGTDDEPVEIIDEGTETFVADLKILAGEDAEADEPSALGPQSFAMSAASRPYIYVPKTTRNGRAVKQKYYYYDPNASHPKRKPWKKTWHDYGSSKSPDSYGRASFKGPCGRHDLCIEFKQATDRGYCDSFLKKNMRTNCRYAYSSVFDALALRICYGHAAGYYAAVAHSTKGNHDPGRWGNSNPSYYPQYRWDTW